MFTEALFIFSKNWKIKCSLIEQIVVRSYKGIVLNNTWFDLSKTTLNESTV